MTIANADVVSIAALNNNAVKDLNSPTLHYSTPPDGTSNFPTYYNIELVFSTAIQAGTGKIVIVNRQDANDSRILDINDTSQVRFSGNTITLDPAADLQSGTHYAVTIDAGVITSDLGAAFAGVTALAFTTADLIAPTLTHSTLMDGSEIAVNTPLVFEFSEPVRAGSGSIVIKNIHDAADTRTLAANDTGQVQFYNNQVSIQPTAPLNTGSCYAITMDNLAIIDFSCNSYAGISDTSAVSFTTSTAILLKIISSFPTAGATGVSIGENIVFNFNKVLVPGNGAILLYKDDATVVERFDMSTGTGSKDGHVTLNENTLIIDPAVALDAATGYYIRIENAAILDTDGHAYSNPQDAIALNFKTAAAADTAPPLLLHSIPVQDATGIAVGDNLVLTFSEAIIGGNGAILISDGNDNREINVADTQQIIINDNIVTINPNIDLEPNSTYSVVLPAGAFNDLAGNAQADIRLLFSTVDTQPPYLIDSIPLNAAKNVFVDTDLTLVFSEKVLAGSGHFSLYISDGTLIETFDVITGIGSAGGKLDIVGTKVILNPAANLLPDTEYYLRIDGKVVTDNVGNPCNSNSLNFITATIALPKFQGATINGHYLAMTYDHSLDSVHLPDASAFAIKINDMLLTSSDYTISVASDNNMPKSSKISFALTEKTEEVTDNILLIVLVAVVTPKDIVTIAYTDPTPNDDLNAIQDLAGNDAASLAEITVINLTEDTTPPLFQSAQINANYLTLTYDEELDATQLPSAADFTIEINAIVSSDFSVKQVNGNTLIIKLAQPVLPLDNVTIAYTNPMPNSGLNAIQDLAGNDAATLLKIAVTNVTLSDGIITLTAPYANVSPTHYFNTTGMTTAGNDIIHSTANFLSHSSIDGGNGIDRLILTDSSTNPVTLDAINQLTAIEIVTFFNGADWVTTTGDLIAGVTGAFDGNYGNDTLNLVGNDITAHQLDTVRNFEMIYLGGLGAQTIISPDTLVAALATLHVSPSADSPLTFILNFDGSAETNGNFILDGGLNADTLIGGAGNDTLNGFGGNDQLDARAGNDTLYSSGGDNLIGGLGADLFIVSGTAGLPTQLVDWEADIDRLVIDSGAIVNYAGGGIIDFAVGVNNYGTLSVIGSDDGDLIKGAAGANVIDGRMGNDMLIGNGIDTLIGGAGDDLLTGSDNSSWIDGGAGNDRITGGNQHDTIDGGAGNDRIAGGGGYDDITGGTGADDFQFNTATSGSGYALIEDFSGASGDGDRIVLINFVDPLIIQMGTADALHNGNLLVLIDSFASIDNAAAAIAANDLITMTTGIFLFYDTVYNEVKLIHSNDLANDGTEKILAVFSGIFDTKVESAFTGVNTFINSIAL